MNDIIIVGAGGFGREALELIKQINKNKKQWNIKGFIDDNPYALNGKNSDYMILGSIIEWQPSRNEVFVVGISTPLIKEKVTNILKEKGAKFVTLISPFAVVSDLVEIGEGCVITAGSSIAPAAKIGKFVHIGGSMVGLDAIIGDYSTTTGFSNITNAQLGKRVFVGSHAVILNGKKVGDDAFICAGSIVFNNVKMKTKVFGNPAREMDFSNVKKIYK